MQQSVTWNEKYINDAYNAYWEHNGPRVGDIVRMLDGRLLRFTHKWDDGIQVTTTHHKEGSFYLYRNGLASYSGSLSPSIKFSKLKATPGRHLGKRIALDALPAKALQFVQQNLED